MVAGVWLLVSAFLTSSQAVPAAFWNTVVVGLALTAFSLAATRTSSPAPSWVNLGLGLWLIASPFILPYQGFSEVITNSLIIGIGVAILGLIAAMLKTPMGHGRVRGV